MRYLLVFVAAMAVSGCAKPSTWHKPGVPFSAAYKDGEKCRYEAMKATAGGFGTSYRESQIITTCMELAGYKLVPLESVPPEYRRSHNWAAEAAWERTLLGRKLATKDPLSPPADY